MAYTDIDDSSSAFQCKTYTGNGSTNNITLDGNSNLQPDWVWIKDTGQSGYNHNIFDSVRGATKLIWSNLTNAEGTYSNSLTSFNSDGFTLGADSNGEANGNSNSYVSWNWKAGGSGSSNSNGNITSTVSANTTAGFSIVSYTGNGSAGATVGHGLGSAANLLIVKKRSSTAQWVFGSTALDSSWDNFLFLDATSAKGNADNVFNDTAPTSSVFSIGNAGDTNASGQTYIAYCFAEKQGFSKFGSYTGNGSASSGTFVYTGFKPAFVLCKLTSGAGYGWTLFDNKRIGFNELNYTLQPDGNAAQNTGGGNGRIDILSNGFKLRTTDAGINGSGSEYTYMAFAENPFTTSTGVPATAR